MIENSLFVKNTAESKRKVTKVEKNYNTRYSGEYL